MSNQSAVNVIRGQFEQMKGWYEGTMADVTDELAQYDPPGLVSPIGAQAAHVVTGMDYFLVGLAAGKQPLMASSFAEKNGISELPPGGGDWGDWGTRVKVDLSAFDAYAKAVFAEVDTYLGSISDADLQEKKEFGGAGEQTVGWALDIIMLNTYSHVGEISAIKGMKGLKGYPF
ncbi:MAG: DinB family protein [Chloroflexota bacterium]